MYVHMRHIKEEWLIPAIPDKFYTFFRISFRKASLIWLLLDHLLPMKQRKGREFFILFCYRHVVTKRQSIVIIKSMICRQKSFLIPTMPFPNMECMIPGAF